MTGVAEMAREFGARPENSARSVLVTILGDSVLPLGGRVWLGDLITLMEPFGCSARLVRTSVYRLTSEGWLESDRIGRRSRYHLTDHARREFAVAEDRIYGRPAAEWSGDWTLVLTDVAEASGEQDRMLEEHLRWAGFARLAPGVQVLPGDGVGQLRELEGRLALPARLPVARARFDDLAPLVANGRITEVFGLAEAAERYAELLARGRALSDDAVGRLQGRDAFAVRTMLVHDLRRAALVDPRLPEELLPRNWAGFTARDLAGAIYREVEQPAWRWLEDLTRLRAGPTGRFRSS